MKISIVAAVAKNGVIGKDNNLPWCLPSDLAYFKQLTLNKVVIMGRLTYESIGYPLPQRTNMILSSNPNYFAPNCQVFTSLKEAIDYTQAEEVMIIGGASIYAEAVPLATHLYLTFVDIICEGDTFFPKIEMNDWEEISREEHASDENNMYSHRFITLKRR